MDGDKMSAVFTSEVLASLLPPEKADSFFEALFGDASDGAYDIELSYKSSDSNTLQFELRLKQRPGKCLGCHLTYGLPEVFSRHPVINVKGIVSEIEKLLDGRGKIEGWRLGATRELSRELHVIPLTISLAA